MTPGEKDRIAAIEKRLGPVGKGHHNSHRTAALLKWLKKKESGKKDSEKNDTPQHETAESKSEKKQEGD